MPICQMVKKLRKGEDDFRKVLEAFTYGRRLNVTGGGKFLSIRERIMRMEEKREFRVRLKILYEKKASSVCCIRDKLSI